MVEYCPRCKCGIPKIEYRYECRQCGFCLYINAPAAVCAVIYNPEGKVLLTQRARDPRAGYWELPGGYVDPGESAEEALVREIKEEMAVDLKGYEYFYSHPNEYEFKGMTYYPLDLFFSVPMPAGEVVVDEDEIAGWQFFAWGGIPWDKLAFRSYGPGLRLWHKIYLTR